VNWASCQVKAPLRRGFFHPASSNLAASSALDRQYVRSDIEELSPIGNRTMRL